MGALAPISSWIPEDDLLLKDSIEAGASLESLAKGAVQFSRRFTIGELQERWHSLLYDPVISEEASTRMLELQKSISDLSSKSDRCGASKGNEWIPKKRKEKSVRSHYYAMRKRICTEPCSSIDLSFLVAPHLHKCSGSGGGYQEQLILLSEHPDGNYPIAADFGLQDTDFDIVRHAFPHIVSTDTAATNVCGTAHAFHYGHRDSFEGDLPDGIMGRDCLYGFAENVSPFSINDAVGNDMRHSLDHNNVQKDIPLLGQSLSSFDNKSGVQEIGPTQELPVSAFDSITNNQETVCSGFSPVLDCSASFQQLGYSSPVPIDEKFGDKDKTLGDSSTLPHDDDNNDAKKVSTSGHNVGNSRTQLEERKCGDGFASSSVIAEGDLLDLSHSPLNFTHEEVLLFMDDDGKNMMEDRSCLDSLNSIFLNSPIVHQNDASGTSDPISVALNTGLTVTDVACPSELDVVGEPLHSGQKDCDSEIVTQSLTKAPNPHSPELRNGVICCTLNMEDPEIPCNDHFPPSQMLQPCVSSAMQHNSEGSSSVATPNKSFVNNDKDGEQGLNLVNEKEETPGIVVSCKIESQVLHEICLNDSGVKSVLLESDREDPGQCRSVPAAQHSILDEASKKELWKDSDFDNSLERQVHVSDHIKNQTQKNFDACQQQADVSVAVPNNAELSSMEIDFPEHMPNPSISDQEEELSENDDNLPDFSDIEAMILDMDLGPSDQDSYLSKEVSIYQSVDTKGAFIRLEQCANSYMQRAIASHRAFAILYGHHLKHYIKKPKVLLGRAAEGITVDIDLGREGRANKISRRQAIIKMEQDGSFYLTNLGKCSVLVNSKELSGGHCLKLSSSCLIEIRGMRFLFEVNQNLVRQYLAKNAKRPKERVASLTTLLTKGYHK